MQSCHLLYLKTLTSPAAAFSWLEYLRIAWKAYNRVKILSQFYQMSLKNHSCGLQCF